jgi:hypothetical protein
VRDPSGAWVDVGRQTDPASGFWDAYASKAGVRKRLERVMTRAREAVQ